MTDEDPLKRRYLLRFKLGVVILVLLAVPAVLHSYAAIDSLFNKPSDWVPNSQPVKVEFNHFVKYFSAADVVMLAWDGSDLGAPALDQAADLFRPLCDDYSQTAAEDREELPPWAIDEIQAIRDQCESETICRWVRTGSETLQQMTSAPANLSDEVAIGRLKGSLVGPDGEQTCLILSLNVRGLLNRRFTVPRIRAMVARIAEREVEQVAIVGGPFEGSTIDSASIRSIRTFSPPSALLAAILCLICLRSIPLTAAIVAVAVIGEGLVLAAVYYTGVPMNAILIVLPPLVFVLTVSAGIHLSNYYLDAAHEFPELTRAQAAQRAMQAGVAPCSLATGTTVVGLSSLMLVRLEPVRIFGGVASLGVTVTLLLLFLMLPGAMVLTAPRKKKADDDADSDTDAKKFAGLWMRRRLAKPWPVIVSFLLVAAVLSFGLTRLHSSVNIPRMFMPESDIRQQYAWFETNLGPTATGDLLLTFPPLTEDDDPLERLALVREAHVCALKQDAVSGVLSPMTFVPSIPRGRSLGAAARRSVIKKLIRNPDSSLGRLGFIARDAESEVWRISIRLPQREEVDQAQEIRTIRRAVVDVLAASETPVQVTLTGHVAIVQESQEILLRDLFRSFMTAFGIIAVVMMLMLRSVIGGLIAMIPNLFPTVALFGFMGLIRLPLDIGTVMSASVALGIAVDDTVHLLSRYGSRRAHGLGQIRAAYGALAQCGWAMFQTTLVCGLSLMVYWFSDFVPTSRFSLFMFGLLSAALLGVVFLLPTLMSTPLGRWLSHTVGTDSSAELYADEHEDEPPQDVRRLPGGWKKTRTPRPESSDAKDYDSSLP